MGCLILALAIFLIGLFTLSAMGLEGPLALLPPAVLGLAAGIGVWARGYITGAMIEEEQQ